MRWLALLLVLPMAAAQNTTNATAPRLRDAPRGLVSGIVESIGKTVPILQGEIAAFIITLLVWAALAALVVLILVPAMKWLTRRTKADIDDVIIAIVGRPLFFLIFVYGIVDSLLALSLPAAVDLVLWRLWRIVVIIQLTIIIYKLWKEVLLALGREVATKTENDLDDKLYPFFSKVGGVVIILVSIWMVVSSFGIDMTFFAAGGAIGGLVIAFAAQDTLANFFAGIHILLDRPFREGDRIEIKEENTWGDVVDIGLRTTRIRTRDNRLVVVPNSVIGSNPIVNHSFPDTTYRIGIDVGVAYGSDVEKVRQTLLDAVATVEGVMGDERTEALFLGFGDSALNWHVRAWFPHYLDKRRYEDKLHTAIEQALREAGIEIPFPQRVLWNGANPDAPVVKA